MEDLVKPNSSKNSILNPSSSYSKGADFRQRRRLEMKKRLGVLHYRRDRLERELIAIQSALLTLDSQLKKDNAFEQLSICD